MWAPSRPSPGDRDFDNYDVMVMEMLVKMVIKMAITSARLAPSRPLP